MRFSGVGFMSKRYVAVGMTAAIVLAGLTGCTAHQAKDTAQAAAEAADTARSTVMAALARTTDTTERAKSAVITAKITGAGQPAPMTATGTYTWGSQPAFDTQINTASAGVSDLRAAPTTRMLFVGGAYYYQIDPQDSGPFTGKHWMRVDASAILGEQGEAAISHGSGDPTAGLKALKYARDAQDLGPATVHGKATRHYVVHVSPGQWGTAGDALTGRGKGSQMEEYTGKVREITLALWVDPRTNLPVRMEETIGAARVEIDFKGFGGARTITAPPAADTADVTEQVKGHAGSEPTDSDATAEESGV